MGKLAKFVAIGAAAVAMTAVAATPATAATWRLMDTYPSHDACRGAITWLVMQDMVEGVYTEYRCRPVPRGVGLYYKL